MPKTTDKAQGIMDFFQIFDADDLRALPRGLWGIREPDEVHNGTQRPTGEQLRTSNSEYSLTSFSLPSPYFRTLYWHSNASQPP